jgi:tetratricopeptide (TPR) repeat protein
MGSYLYTASDRAGSPVVGRVEADTIASARRLLEAEGYAGVQFQTDSWDAATRSGSFDRVPEIEVSPEDELAARQQGLRWMFLALARNHGPVLGVLLLWNAWSLYAGRPFGWGDGVGFALTIAYIGFLVWAVFPVLAFNRMLAAQSWGRWSAMRAALRWLRWVPGPTALAPHQLDYYEARALVGLGLREEAFARYRRWEGSPALPQLLFEGMMATLHDAAREFDAVEARYRAIARLAPESAQPWLDIAALLVRRGIRHEDAIAALAEGDRREQTPLMVAYADHVRGVLALDRDDYSEAVRRLVAAMEGLRAAGAIPLVQVLRAMFQGYLAAAVMRSGRRREGDRLWRAVLPRLQALRCHELIERYAAAAIGRPWTPGNVERP